MPLQINDPRYGDQDYYDKRRAMLGKLNQTANLAHIVNPGYYSDNHDIVKTNTEQVQKAYPKQFADLQEQNTDAKIRALNELDFMDSDSRHTNNPIAQLGAQGANTRMRMPMAWADNHPEYGDGRLRGFYTPSNDALVIPMHTMSSPEAGGANTVVHETMHRGFTKMDEPSESNPEHNYIYQKMRKNYADPQYNNATINHNWESRPGFRYEPKSSQDAFNAKQSTRFEAMARSQLGTGS
ncbi:MAG: hypothetical protein DRQ35_07090 [Gammaproteobacteria bacterium]|nr:MAG: hypothetical protein DRQ35_07090 [Gammaproteobacteria bacterium]